MHRLALSLVVGLLACGKSDKAKPNTEPAVPQGKFDQLAVTVGADPLAIDRAFIKRTSPDAYVVLVGAGKGSCEELLSGTDKTAAGAKSFGFTLVRRVAASGHDRYWITDLWSRDFETKLALPISAAFSGSADKGATASLAIVAKSASFTANGNFTAVGCGEVAPTGLGVPRTPHGAKGKIEVAGQWIPIRGVTVKARPGVAATDLPDIVISTNIKDCSTVTLPAPIILARANGKWSMRGTWFDAPIEDTVDGAKELTFSANSVAKSADGPTLMLQLSGAGTIGDYSVRIEGTAEAIECTN